MWVVIHMVKGQKEAERIKAAIEKEGIMVRILPVYKKIDQDENYYKITVLEVEAEEAREIMMVQM